MENSDEYGFSSDWLEKINTISQLKFGISGHLHTRNRLVFVLIYYEAVFHNIQRELVIKEL